MRRWLIILALPLLLWSAYWGAAAYTLKQGVADVLQGQEHGAVSSSYTEARISGFPTDFQINMSDLEVRQAGVFSWTLPEMELHAPSYQPQTVRLDFDGEQTVQTRFGTLHLEANLLEIAVFLRPALALPLGRAQLQLEEARLTHEGQGGQGNQGSDEAGDWQLELKALQVELRDLPDTRQADQGDNAPYPYQLSLAATDLDLSEIGSDLPPDYQVMEVIVADLGLGFSDVWDRSVLNEGMPRLETLLIRESGLRLGESELRMTGQLERADTGVLSGSLVVDVQNWRELLAVLRGAGYVNPDVADLIVEFLGDQYPSDKMTLPLQIQDGQIQFGVFTLGVLPALP